MASREKKSLCLNVELRSRDFAQLVKFRDIPEFYPPGESIVLNYEILKTYSPKSEDLIGLFKCNRESENTFEFVASQWAQKRPSFKEKPLRRTITFDMHDAELEQSDDSYVFLYMTLHDRILGQSSQFKFNYYLKGNRLALSTDLIQATKGDISKEKNKSSNKLKHSKPSENKELEGNHISCDQNDMSAQLDENEKVTLDLYSLLKKQENRNNLLHESVLNNLPHETAEDLLHKNLALKLRVDKIEEFYEVILSLQKTLEEQMIQCMNIVKNSCCIGREPEMPAAEKLTTNPTGTESAFNKNMDYYFTGIGKNSYSGSAMAFQHLFGEVSEQTDNNVTLTEHNSHAIKKAATDIDRPNDDKIDFNQSANDTKKSRSLQHSSGETVDASVKLVPGGCKDNLEVRNSLQIPALPSYPQMENDHQIGSMHTSHLEFDLKKGVSHKTTQQPSTSELDEPCRRDNTISIIFNGNNGFETPMPCIVLKEAFKDGTRNEALILDITQDKSIIIQPTSMTKKEKSTDCDSALIPLLCVHG